MGSLASTSKSFILLILESAETTIIEGLIVNKPTGTKSPSLYGIEDLIMGLVIMPPALTKKVYPSGALFATKSAPNIEPAPGLFSTIIG